MASVVTLSWTIAPGIYRPAGWREPVLAEGIGPLTAAVGGLLFSASPDGGSVAFYAQVSGFFSSVLATRVFTGVGRIAPHMQ